MSVVKETLVFCDGCSDQLCGDDRSCSAKVIRKNRALVGWIQVGSLDYCPRCAEERRRSGEGRVGRKMGGRKMEQKGR